MEAITSLDDHFQSHVFEKVDASREGQEIGVKAKSPIPSIQITGLYTRVGKTRLLGPWSMAESWFVVKVRGSQNVFINFPKYHLKNLIDFCPGR